MGCQYNPHHTRCASVLVSVVTGQRFAANMVLLVQTSKLFAPLFKLERWVASALFPYSMQLMSLLHRLFVVVFVD
jgi:hypothetical protein